MLRGRGFLVLIALAAIIGVGCGSVDEYGPTPQAETVVGTPAAPSPTSGQLDGFHFVLGKGLGEWHLEELLFNARFDVMNGKVQAAAQNVPYLNKGGASMVMNGLTANGIFDPQTGTMDAHYSVANTETSGSLTYVQSGEGSLKGVLTPDKVSMVINVEGTKTSITKEGDREINKVVNGSRYTVTVPLLH